MADSFWKRAKKRSNDRDLKRQYEEAAIQSGNMNPGTWEGGVAAIRGSYSQAPARSTATHVDPATGTPDNNSPGANVPTGQGKSVWIGSREETTEATAPKRMSVWANRERNPTPRKEAVRDDSEWPEGYEWVYEYSARSTSPEQKGEIASFLKNQGLVSSDDPSDEELTAAMRRWTRDNGYAEFDGDARKALAQGMAGTRQ